MFNLFVQLLPLAIVGAMAPPDFLMSTALLRSKRPLPNATVFTSGHALVLLLVGVVVLAILDRVGNPFATRSGWPTIDLWLGIVFLALALRFFLGTPDPDAPPPRWMGLLKGIGPARATLFGMLGGAMSAKKIGIVLIGLGEIAAANLGLVQSLVPLVVFIAVLELGLIAPVVVYLFAPARAEVALGAAEAWLTRHSGLVLGLVFVLFGVYFTWRGVSILLGEP
jgi:hypothetical protein